MYNMDEIVKKAPRSRAPPRPVLTPSTPNIAITKHNRVLVAAPTPRPRQADSEKHEQERLVAWLRANHIRHHSIPNSAPKDARTGAEFVRSGLVRGVPDLYVFIPGIGPVAVEMKRANGHTSDVDAAQWEWLEALPDFGFTSAIAFGYHAAAHLLSDLLARGIDT